MLELDFSHLESLKTTNSSDKSSFISSDNDLTAKLLSG